MRYRRTSRSVILLLHTFSSLNASRQEVGSENIIRCPASFWTSGVRSIERLSLHSSHTAGAGSLETRRRSMRDACDDILTSVQFSCHFSRISRSMEASGSSVRASHSTGLRGSVQPSLRFRQLIRCQGYRCGKHNPHEIDFFNRITVRYYQK